MAHRTFDFTNSAGQALYGVLETGDGAPHGWAVFAHCFTCDKTSLAATRISRALAARGIGVLRFDFTGLGESEGDFGRGLSGDIGDVVCAAEAMAKAGMEPGVLVGHSFGGAAVLAAAGSLETVKAVAVVGAPFDAEHVLGHIGEALEGAGEGERVPVAIAGRDFELGADFVRDICGQNQKERIENLDRALLILHSPVDDVVGADNASGIFMAARHPKSFVSLDQANHLLTKKADTDYVAEVITAWASRYLLPAEATETKAVAGGVHVETTGTGKFQSRVTTPNLSFMADEPASVGGTDTGPTPYELVSAGLGACTAMTCKMYADRKGWPLDEVSVTVGHTGKTKSERDRFIRTIGFSGDLDDEQRSRLMEIADRCPVHRTLEESAIVETKVTGDQATDVADDCRDAHGAMMDEACAEQDSS